MRCLKVLIMSIWLNLVNKFRVHQLSLYMITDSLSTCDTSFWFPFFVTNCSKGKYVESSRAILLLTINWCILDYFCLLIVLLFGNLFLHIESQSDWLWHYIISILQYLLQELLPIGNKLNTNTYACFQCWFVSAVHFDLGLVGLSSMMLIWAAGARCKWRAHLHNRMWWQRFEPQAS